MKSANFFPRWSSRYLIIFVIPLFIWSLTRIDSFGKALVSNKGKFFAGTILETKVTIPDLPLGKARYDNQRILRIYDFHIIGTEWESLLGKYDICFATQTSIERMYWLPYILERWTAPLSIAVRLISEEEWLIFNLYINYLKSCNPAFESQVAIHLAVPSSLGVLKIDDSILSQWEGISLKEILEKGKTCPEAKEYLKYLLELLPTTDRKKLELKEVYPQNHMRNIGRKGCGTHWTYSADVDIIPCNGMADKLQQFYDDLTSQKKHCAKCAYVVPVFEINETYPFPENKKKVVKLFKTGAIRQYNIGVYKHGQNATDYKKWISSKIDQKAVTISHKINKKLLKNVNYEPFYVSPDDIVPFDERFLGYGWTRNSQFKAAFTAGWNFSVLTPVFSIHWGLQTMKTYEIAKKGGTGKSVRSEQVKANEKVYEGFLKELNFKKEIGTL